MTSTRHLLRHLGDPGELRRNPLLTELAPRVCDELVLCTIVRAAVARAFSSFIGNSANQTRLSHILERCDLQGEPNKRVAADLGMSVRQLYRDRKRAMPQLEVLLRQELKLCSCDRSIETQLSEYSVARLLLEAIGSDSRELRLVLLTRALTLTVEGF